MSANLVDLSTTTLWTSLFPIVGCLLSSYFYHRMNLMYYYNANSVDHDQTPHYAVSVLGLHCLPITLLWVSWQNWIKTYSYCESCQHVLDKGINIFVKKTRSVLSGARSLNDIITQTYYPFYPKYSHTLSISLLYYCVWKLLGEWQIV